MTQKNIYTFTNKNFIPENTLKDKVIKTYNCSNESRPRTRLSNYNILYRKYI